MKLRYYGLALFMKDVLIEISRGFITRLSAIYLAQEPSNQVAEYYGLIRLGVARR